MNKFKAIEIVFYTVVVIFTCVIATCVLRACKEADDAEFKARQECANRNGVWLWHEHACVAGPK